MILDSVPLHKPRPSTFPVIVKDPTSATESRRYKDEEVVVLVVGVYHLWTSKCTGKGMIIMFLKLKI